MIMVVRRLPHAEMHRTQLSYKNLYRYGAKDAKDYK